MNKAYMGLAGIGLLFTLTLYNGIKTEDLIIKKPDEGRYIHITKSPIFGKTEESYLYEEHQNEGILKSVVYDRGRFGPDMALAIEKDGRIETFYYNPYSGVPNYVYGQYFSPSLIVKEYDRETLTRLVAEAKANIGNQIRIKTIYDKIQRVEMPDGSIYEAKDSGRE